MKKLFQTFDGVLFETQKDALNYELAHSQKTVVIVDDDSEILEILSNRLQSGKIKHITFLDPFEAMNFISKNEIEHVFTDYHMKGYGISGKWIKEICIQYGIACSIVSGDESIADINKIDFLNDCVSFIQK